VKNASRSIVESSADWIWETDRDGQHTFCNPCVEGMLGYSRKELLGASRLNHVHPGIARASLRS